MAEFKHPQQQWPGNRPTRSATKRPQSRPLILLPLSSSTGRGQRTSDVVPGGRRRTLQAGMGMIGAISAGESTTQAVADQEIL